MESVCVECVCGECGLWRVCVESVCGECVWRVCVESVGMCKVST